MTPRAEAKRISSKVAEAEVLKSCLYYLRLVGVKAWRINTMGVPLKGGGFRPAPARGISDIIAVYRGYAIAIECKSPRGHLSEDQELFRDDWESAGGFYLVVHSAEELKDALKVVMDDLLWSPDSVGRSK